MIWGAFSSYGKLEIEFIHPKMDAQDYQKVLEKKLLPYLRNLPNNSMVFMQDNASVHTATATKRWLQRNRVETGTGHLVYPMSIPLKIFGNAGSGCLR